MTEIEEEFYKTFDIEPVTLKDFNYNTLDYDFKTIYINGVRYPKITDRILLELICILNQYYCNNYQCATILVGSSVEEVKRCILVECLENVNHIKTVIRALFEQGAEDE